MSKKALAFILMLLFSAVVVLQSVDRALANFVPYPAEPNKDTPSLTVQTPQNTDVYNTSTINVNFTVTKPASWLYDGPFGRTLYYWWVEAQVPIIGTYSIGIYLDGNLTVPYILDLGAENGIDNLTANYSKVLLGLTRGPHHLKIEVMASTFYNTYYPNQPPEGEGIGEYKMNVSETIHFVVDTPPRISILSPAGKNYSTTDIPLDFTTDQAVSQITYSLDGQENVTITGNMTLTGLPDGPHNLTIYATDRAGRTGTSETIYFSTAKKTEPFPTALVIVTLVSVAVVSLGLLIYFRKRNH